jgi:tRNA A37 threonylcarbamoyladenosine dehydratase
MIFILCLLYCSNMHLNPRFQRLAILTGTETIDTLSHSSVIIMGVGGVGSWCAEALVRSGVGAISLVDSDMVCITNINRQVQADTRTIGQSKVAVLKQRLQNINPDCTIDTFEAVFSGENADMFGLECADYIIDAIDSITYKLDLIEAAFAAGTTIFSSMGTAQKLDPTQLKIASIWETSGCPLARLVRSGLRARNFTQSFMVVYSTERLPIHDEIAVSCGSGLCLCPKKKSCTTIEWCASKKIINGSAVPVTATAGMILASLVLRDAHSRGQV